MTILFLFNPSEALFSFLKSGLSDYPDLQWCIPAEMTEEKWLEHAPKATVMIGWRPTEAVLLAATNLKLFINPGAGIQHQIKRFRKVNEQKEVVLVNGHGNAYFTAQHTVALLLALTNKIVAHDQWMREGKWRLGDQEAASIPMRDRTIGLLGYGAINQKVHQFLAGFTLQFAALKTQWKEEEKNTYPTSLQQYTPEQLHEFLTVIDTLIIAVPHTSRTEAMIGKKELELLGKEGLLVNVSRGKVIVEEALYNALQTKEIAGAAIDVWYNYQATPDEQERKFPYHFPFYQLDNVVLSPHRAASPFSDLKRWEEVVENLKRVAAGRSDYINIVNLEREY